MNPQMYRDGYTYGVDDEAVTKKALADLDLQLRYEGPQNVAAILMESIVGANGVILPPKGYMEGVRKLCDKYGILMICDEVMAGFFRTGKWFAWQNFDFVPDMITFAKGVTCGYVQLGGVIVNKKVANYFEENVLQCGLTYSGHTLACAAGVAALTYYKEHNIEQHVAEMHEIVAPFMQKMVEKHKCVGEARCTDYSARSKWLKIRKQENRYRSMCSGNSNALDFRRVKEKRICNPSDVRISSKYARR